MKEISQIKLSEVIKLIPKPRYVLGTTYTLSLAFFESTVFPCISRSELRSCVIICDSIGYRRALAEGPAIQGAAQDYLVVPAPGADCFHPKVWLVIGDREAIVLVGSGNLTQAGFMTNVELFDALHIRKENPAESGLLESVRGFLQGLAGMWNDADAPHLLCVEMLGKMEQALADLPVASGGKNGVRFIHSFAGPLIDQMPEVRNCDRLFVAAPFFGQSVKGLGMLTKRFSPATLRVFPAVQGEGTDVPLNKIDGLHKGGKALSLAAPGKRKDGFRHLKLYGMTTSEKTGWLFCTSANCTEAAWGGGNVEAGVLRPVPVSILAKYFAADDAPLPKGSIHYVPDAPGRDVLHLWASDTGTRLEIMVAENSAGQLPLQNVTAKVRSGSGMGVCEKAVMFQNGRTAHIDWSSFTNWHRAKKMAIFVELRGTGDRGGVVYGQCFVENRLLLTADPIHRSAWRGALALLGEEGMPELSDIAALFSLARDLFDGNLVRPPGSPSATKKNAEPEDTTVAAWPPRPDAGEVQKRLGNTGMGQLRWFQEILRTFLRAETVERNGNATPGHAVLDDGEDDSSQEPERTDEMDHNRNVAERLWAKTEKDYLPLFDRIHKLQPDASQAPNTWTVAIFAFLSTIAVFRAANRLAPDGDWKTNSGILCDDFLRLMLNERRQPDDYCPPRESRYRSEKFPALCDDLRKTYGVRPHYDITNVMLALLTDKKLRWPIGSNPVFFRADVRRVCAPDFIANQDAAESSLLIWKRYFMEPSGRSTENDFKTAFKILTEEFPSPGAV